MPVEIKFTVERKIGRDFQVAWATGHLVMEIDVILLDRFSARIEAVKESA